MVFGFLCLTSLGMITLRSIHVTANGCWLGLSLGPQTVTSARAHEWVFPECPCPHLEPQLPPQETLKTCRWVWPRPLWSCRFGPGPSACEALCVLPKSGVPVPPLPVDSSPADNQSQILWGPLFPMPDSTPDCAAWHGAQSCHSWGRISGLKLFSSLGGSSKWWIWDLIIPWKYPNFLAIVYGGF